MKGRKNAKRPPKGSDSKSRLPRFDVDLATWSPECPGGLSAESQEMWKWVIENLRSRKRLSPTDVPSLERMIFCFEFLTRAENDLLVNGMNIEIHARNGTSYKQTSPSVAQAKQFGDSFRRWAAEFGFTPSGRGGKGGKDKRSALDDFNSELGKKK